jgi:hypothetical protein
MDLSIDHVTVCGSNLEEMRRAFHRIGLSTTYGGRHSNGVTHMDILTFEDGSYVELIAPIGQVQGAPGMMSAWLPRMEGDAGAGAWAVRSNDIHADAARVRAAGIEVRGPEAGSRQRPDGARLEWETAIAGPGPAGSVLPFIIQDKTARSLRVPAPASRSVIRGVATIVIGVRDLAASAELFRRAYQSDAPLFEEHPGFGRIAFFSGTPVVLAAPPHVKFWLADRIARFGECPAAFLLEVRDLQLAKDRFSLGLEEPWLGGRVAWFAEKELRVNLGVIAR